MHIAMIIDEHRLAQEQAMLNRLCIGLAGEGAQVVEGGPEQPRERLGLDQRAVRRGQGGAEQAHRLTDIDGRGQILLLTAGPLGGRANPLRRDGADCPQRLVTAMNAVGRNLAVVIDQGCKENKFQ